MSEKDTRVFNLILILQQSKTMYEEIKQLYGEEYINSIPIDKNILKYFNGSKPKSKLKSKEEPRLYDKNHSYKGKKWLDKEYDIVKNMLHENNTILEISEYMGRSEWSIECVLLKFGFITATISNDNNVYYAKNEHNSVCWAIYQLKKLLLIYDELDNEICLKDILSKMQPEIGISQKIWENGEKRIITEKDIENKLSELKLI